MKILLGLAAICVVVFVALVGHQPHVDYGTFETSCRSAASPGADGRLLEYDGGVTTTDIVGGEDVVDDLDEKARAGGAADSYFIQDRLDADCADKRTQVLVEAQVVGMAFAACLAGAALLAVRRPREQAPPYVPPEVPSA